MWLRVFVRFRDRELARKLFAIMEERSKTVWMKKTCIKILFTDMYKNIVPLPEVSVDPPVGPQINTSSDMGGVWSRSLCGRVCVRCLGVWVLGGLVRWVHHSAHEQDGSWNRKRNKDKFTYSHPKLKLLRDRLSVNFYFCKFTFSLFPYLSTRGHQNRNVQILHVGPLSANRAYLILLLLTTFELFLSFACIFFLPSWQLLDLIRYENRYSCVQITTNIISFCQTQ